MSSSSKPIVDLCDEFWQWRMEEWPELATFCGDHRYDDRLNDNSEQAFFKRQVKVRELLEKCQALRRDGANVDDMNLLLLTRELEAFNTGLDQKGFIFAINNMHSIHKDFEVITGWMKFETLEDYQKYTSRLEQLPNRISADIEVAKLGISLGKTLSIQGIDRVPSQIDNLMTLPKETVFYKPLLTVPTADDRVSDIDSLAEEAVSVIESQVFPSLQTLKTFVEQEYIPACRPHPGLHSMTGGQDFYQYILHWHTSLPLIPQQVHDLGWKEITRIKAEMMQVLHKVGYEGDLKDFQKELDNNQAFNFKDEDDILKSFQDLAHNTIRPLLSKFFHKVPASPLSIVPMMAVKAKAKISLGFYLGGSGDGSRPGQFHVSTLDLENMKRYKMVSITLHEGEPGHHFQNIYSTQNKSLPEFRRMKEEQNNTIAPSRFPMHTACSEGWGLYCESLGSDLGLYEDQYSLFGCLLFELQRACRLVVDTGIHALGWNFDDAVSFMLEHANISKSAAIGECKRYCTWPGQACAYTIGALKIKELREKATKALGDAFDIRDFHDEILSAGPVSLDVLDQVIDKYINTHLHRL